MQFQERLRVPVVPKRGMYRISLKYTHLTSLAFLGAHNRHARPTSPGMPRQKIMIWMNGIAAQTPPSKAIFCNLPLFLYTLVGKLLRTNPKSRKAIARGRPTELEFKEFALGRNISFCG